jgi:hypothetical protein
MGTCLTIPVEMGVTVRGVRNENHTMNPILWCHKHGYEDRDQCPKCQEVKMTDAFLCNHHKQQPCVTQCDGCAIWEKNLRSWGAPYFDVVFDGPVQGRFVEVENPQRHSITVGEWIHRDDGYWVLRIPLEAKAELLAIHEAVMNPQAVVINESDTFTVKLVKQFIQLSQEWRKEAERSNAENEQLRRDLAEATAVLKRMEEGQKTK